MIIMLIQTSVMSKHLYMVSKESETLSFALLCFITNRYIIQFKYMLFERDVSAIGSVELAIPN